ncbi:hypothetical protein [Streptomyces cinereoruber]
MTVHSILPASQAEYEAQMRRLEEEAESARQAFIQAKGNYDRLCGEMRNLRIAWRDQQETTTQQPQPANNAGLVTKNSAYPDRIKPHRGRHTHAATYAPGLLMHTACNKKFEEDNVDHLEESDPITCPACQRAVKNNA